MFDELTEELLDLRATVQGYGAAAVRGGGGCVQLELLQPLHDGRPLLPPLLVTPSPPSVPARPALAPWCRVVEDDARVLVEHGGTLVTLEGRAARSLLPDLLPLLDGTRTVDEVGAAVGARAPPGGRPGARAPGAPPTARRRAYHRAGDADAASAASYAASVTRRTSPAGAVAALAGASVARRRVRPSGPRGRAAAPPRAGSARSSARGRRDGRHGGGASSSPHHRRTTRRCCADLNRACLDRRAAVAPAAPVRRPPDRRRAALPPRRLGVRDVLRVRRAACSGYEDDFALLERLPLRARAAAAPRRRCGPRRDRRVSWLTVADPSLPGHLHAVECGHPLGVSSHRVLRVPRCPDCGPFDQAVPSPWFAETA